MLNLPVLLAEPVRLVVAVLVPVAPRRDVGERRGSTGSGTSGARARRERRARFANLVSFLALAGALCWLVVVTVRRRLEPFAAAAAAVTIFVLCNKVYSPTYDVWLVVFFVMLPLSRRLWLTFCVVDLAVFVTVYGYFDGVDSLRFVRTVLPVLVLIRTGVLLVLVARSTARATVEVERRAVLASCSRPGWRNGRRRRLKPAGLARGVGVRIPLRAPRSCRSMPERTLSGPPLVTD